MFLSDKLSISGTQLTDEGYLVVNARTARVGVQQYLGSEVGKPELAVVNVYRDESEVFKKQSLHSFSRIPITVDHPSVAVSATNWRDLAVGTTGDEVLRDGEYLKIGLKITDANAVKAIREGKRELSVGYDALLVWGDGTAPDGTPYQARQTAIAANHIAIVDVARGGPELRIGDGAPRKQLNMMTDAERQAMRDSVYGMPLDQAEGLPLFDDVRGTTMSGMPGERYMAMIYGATPQADATADARRDAAYDQMKTDLNNAWRH